jgi:3-phenylpropionate/cinnamic acid dioxygenase small subunit
MSKLNLTVPIALAVLLTIALFQTGEAKGGTADATTRASERAQYTSVSDPDRSEITDLIYRYSYTIDARDLEGFVSLFTEDCRWVANLPEKPIILNSRTKLREHVATRLKYFTDNGIQTRHLQMNTILTRIGYDQVQGVTYLVLLGQLKGESTPRLISTGIYTDEFVKTEDGWRFAIREATLDQGRLPSVDK